MTTFNWMVNQLLICPSAAWCGQSERGGGRGTERGENREMRWKRGKKKEGLKERGSGESEETERETWYMCTLPSAI